MANFDNIVKNSANNSANNSLLDTLLPTFGSTPSMANRSSFVWNEGQKMFITPEYVSAAGNRYYRGLRCSAKVAMVEHVGNYYSWTYIDDLKLYVFEGTTPRLVATHKFDKQFYDEGVIRDTFKQMLMNYLSSQCKMQHAVCPDNLEEEAERQVAQCYVSFLSSNYDRQLQNIMKRLELEDD